MHVYLYNYTDTDDTDTCVYCVQCDLLHKCIIDVFIYMYMSVCTCVCVGMLVCICVCVVLWNALDMQGSLSAIYRRFAGQCLAKTPSCSHLLHHEKTQI